MNGTKELEVTFEGKKYKIVRREVKPQYTKVFDEEGREYFGIASKILRAEVKKNNIENSKDGYLYNRSGKKKELITHEYFRKVHNFKNTIKDNVITNKLKGVEELKKVGFKCVGEWDIQDNKINLDLKDMKDQSNVLYSFVVDNNIKYIGKTTKPLLERMKWYEKPGASQSTNIRNNSNIKIALESKQKVEIFCFKGSFSLKYEGYKVNLAAGLEDSLIKKLSPEWNITGK